MFYGIYGNYKIVTQRKTQKSPLPEEIIHIIIYLF